MAHLLHISGCGHLYANECGFAGAGHPYHDKAGIVGGGFLLHGDNSHNEVSIIRRIIAVSIARGSLAW